MGTGAEEVVEELGEFWFWRSGVGMLVVLGDALVWVESAGVRDFVVSMRTRLLVALVVFEVVAVAWVSSDVPISALIDCEYVG